MNMTRAEWVIKVLTESAKEKMPSIYKQWLQENVTLKNIRVCIEDCVCRTLGWVEKYGHKGVLYIQDNKQTFEKGDIDLSEQALILVPYFFTQKVPYYLVIWYIPTIDKLDMTTKTLEIKRWNFLTFEEWQQRDNDVKMLFGAYRVEIRPLIRERKSTLYGLSMCLINCDPTHPYTDVLFSDKYTDEGDIQKLKQWYESTLEAFNDFWENHIKSVYLKPIK